jgi:hypothetical protein
MQISEKTTKQKLKPASILSAVLHTFPTATGPDGNGSPHGNIAGYTSDQEYHDYKQMN